MCAAAGQAQLSVEGGWIVRGLFEGIFGPAPSVRLECSVYPLVSPLRLCIKMDIQSPPGG